MSVEDSLRSLSMDYLNLLINGQAFSDVTFSVDGHLVHAHRCILAARSHFFRKFFCGTESPLSPATPPAAAGSPRSSGAGMVIPVTSVSYEVFLLVLQFLYSGQVSLVPQKHEPRPNCGERGCWHTHCSSAVDLALDTLSAARSFGVEQLIHLAQKQLTGMVEKASVEDVMKVLIASRKHEMHQLWTTCSHLVAKSGLPPEILAKHLPVDVVAKIDELRLKSSNTRRPPPFFPHPHHGHGHHDLGSAVSAATDLEEQKIRRMRRALDSSDVELVKLMVMGEGLNLDEALALHYAVENCTREVVKALLELGAAYVNFPAGPSGKTPLHIAAEMVSPDMVAVLLDHHADPTIRTVDGVSPIDMLRALTSDFLFKGAVPGLNNIEPNKLRLCLELVQSAALVISREEGNASVGTSSAATTTTSILYPSMSDGHSSSDSTSLNLDSRSMMYMNVGANQAGPRINRDDHDRGKRSRDQSLYHHSGCDPSLYHHHHHQPHEF
ncbi:hypothetical protein SAY87_021985 [Trapa incisa]|uniref:Uncharacterized protein n=1 Tax=Trapa incisa TaxID=236973 RepID=A0AAN7JU34_9MYRT|nr:hypothetical protein SAY87_021985 [Trapa incisa]